MDSEGNAYAFNEKETKDPSKSWERPWTTDEIRKNSDKWSLAGDVGLLNHLKEFSHHLISRTHEMEKVVDGLVHQSKDTSAKVNNVINDFQMLSNLKFVENRVYDEAIVDGTKNINLEDQPKSKEQREAEMLARVKQALDLGLSVLDTAFERIEDVESSDSEGEDISQGRTHLEPKDYYEHRPLPFVIGSDEFQNDEYAGLRYLIDDEPILELSAQDDNISSITESSESESEDDLEFEEKGPVISEQPFVVEPPLKQMAHENLNNKRLSDSEGSDLFGDEENGYMSSGSVGEPPVETKPKNTKNTFLDELGSKIKVPPPAAVIKKDEPKPRTPSESFIKKAEVLDQKEEDDDLFSNEDNFLNDGDDDESPFKRSNGLFTTNIKFGSKSDDMFDDKNLFGKTEKVPAARKETIVQKKEEESNSLFGDDDDEQYLFGSFSSSAIASEPKKSFSNVNNPQTTENASKVSSSPAVSTKSSIRSVSSKAKSEDSLFGPDSDEDGLFSSGKTNQKKDVLETTQKKMSFDFGSTNEDDLFSIISTKEKERKSSKLEVKDIPEIKPEADSLFDDSDDFNLFGSETKVKKPESKIEVKPQEKQKTSRRIAAQKEPVPSIFDESSSIDLFSPAKTTKDLNFIPNDLPPLNSPVVKEAISEKVAAISKDFSTLEKIEVPSDKYQLQKENQLTPVMDIPTSVESSEISFETPVDSTNTLSALNKDRAKIQVKRRKPTRKGRQAIQSTEGPNSISENESESKHSTEKFTNPDDLFSSVDFSTKEDQDPPAPAPTYRKKEQQKKDLMSQLISEAQSSLIGKRNSVSEVQNIIDDDDDDLFSGMSTKDKPKSDFSFMSPSSPNADFFDQPKDIPNKLGVEKDDFMASSSLSDDGLFSDQPSTTFHNDVTNEKSPFSPDDDDDIFKIDESKDSMFQGDDIFADSGDDIFANMDKDKYSMFPTMQNDIDDDDDDDIFSNLEKPATTVTKNVKSKNQVKDEKKQNDIFDDPLGLLS